MKLKRVEIRNFRSIASLDLDLGQNCQVLVGLNESGKSNILKALRLLGEEYKPSPDDKRGPLHDEKPIEKSHVWFIFQFEADDLKTICDGVSNVTLGKPSRRPFVSKAGKELDLKQFCGSLSEGLYCVDIITGKKMASRWAVFSGPR